MGFELLSLRWTKRLESWWCSIMLGSVCVDWLVNVVAEAVKCLGCMQQVMAHCCFLMTMCNSLNLSVSTDHYPCLLAFNCYLSLAVIFFAKFCRLNKCLQLCKYFNSNLISDLNVSWIRGKVMNCDEFLFYIYALQHYLEWTREHVIISPFLLQLLSIFTWFYKLSSDKYCTSSIYQLHVSYARN